MVVKRQRKAAIAGSEGKNTTLTSAPRREGKMKKEVGPCVKRIKASSVRRKKNRREGTRQRTSKDVRPPQFRGISRALGTSGVGECLTTKVKPRPQASADRCQPRSENLTSCLGTKGEWILLFADRVGPVDAPLAPFIATAHLDQPKREAQPRGPPAEVRNCAVWYTGVEFANGCKRRQHIGCRIHLEYLLGIYCSENESSQQGGKYKQGGRRSTPRHRATLCPSPASERPLASSDPRPHGL